MKRRVQCSRLQQREAAIQASYSKSFLDSEQQAEFPWRLLAETMLDCESNVDPILTKLLEDIIARRDAGGYLRLREYSDPALYGSVEAYASSARVVSLLKKYPFGKVAEFDPEAKALERFWKAESLCRRTNRRLRHFRRFGYRLTKRHPIVHSVLHRARLLIQNWLGPLNLDEIHDHMRHGPGGTLSCQGAETTFYYKVSANDYTVSSRAMPYAEAAILADPLWRRALYFDALGVKVHQEDIFGVDVPATTAAGYVAMRLKVADNNKVTFVPKNAETLRSIAIEPHLNIYLQLGVGAALRERLRRVGIDLNSQLPNQQLAKRGSEHVDGFWERPATLDLSMASDTVSLEVVRELLPPDWFDLLDSIRSHFGEVGGETIRWEKFSSMGNGFTFELESLVFLALMRATAAELNLRDPFIRVYGDDLICSTALVAPLKEVLEYCGFRLNTEKSFLFGSFRESCGTDWFEGRDVRPFYLSREVRSAKDLVFVANSYYHISNVGCESGATYPRVRAFVKGLIPRSIRDHLLIPKNRDLMENGLQVPWDDAAKSSLVTWDRDVLTWVCRIVVAQPREYRGRDIFRWLQQLAGGRSDDPDYKGYFDVWGYRKLNQTWKGPASDRGFLPPFIKKDREGKLVTIETLSNRGAVTKRNSVGDKLVTLHVRTWPN